MAKTRSAKGVIVDFDLLKIRQKLQQKPVSVDVKARVDFIDKKIRRRNNRKTKQAAAAAGVVETKNLAAIETTEQRKIIDPPKATTEPKVEKTEVDETEVKAEEPVQQKPERKTRQKHRPPVRS